MFPLLPLVVFLPITFIAFLFLVPERNSFMVSLIASVLLLAFAVAAVYLGLSGGYGTLDFQKGYIQSLGINLDLRLNGYSVIFLVMASIVLLAAAFVARDFIKESERIYNVLFLLTSGATVGVFLAGNLFLFYLFWEISEVAMFFIIYIYGGYDRRYAAIKFMLYSIVASLFLLLGILVIYSSLPTHSFNIASIIEQSPSIPRGSQLIALALLTIAFMIKIPAFPFHGWLPDAHTEAPTTGSMMLAGILLKFGGYGLLLMFLMLPITLAYAKYLAMIFGFSALYSAFVAIRQTHLKRLIAYTSIVDMGIASLGIASVSTIGVAGGLYAMLSHGIVISLMFLMAGTLDEAFGTMLISRLKGVARNLPFVAYMFLFGVFALIGIPLTSGFIGDLLVFIGSFGAYGIAGIAPLFALLVLGAFFFWIVEKSFFNTSKAIEPISNPGPEITISAGFLALAAIILGMIPAVLLYPFAI